MPIAKVPVRPPHPLGRKYSSERDHELEQVLLDAHERAKLEDQHYGLIDGKQGHEYTALAEHFFDHPQYEIYNGGFDQEYPLTPAFAFDGDFDLEYDFDPFFDTPDMSNDIGNDMNMRAFPTMKPIEYDPDAMAKRLARARELGNMPNLDGEEGEKEYLRRHRR